MEGLLGRDAEARRLDQLVAAARAGCSAVLAFRGEAGMGKTALLDYAQAAAADLQVIRFDCVESEMELSFAALHQLLRPFLATSTPCRGRSGTPSAWRSAWPKARRPIVFSSAWPAGAAGRAGGPQAFAVPGR